jgi:hypothetical protein
MRLSVGHTPNRTTLGVILTGYKSPVIVVPRLVANPHLLHRVWEAAATGRANGDWCLPTTLTVRGGSWASI